MSSDIEIQELLLDYIVRYPLTGCSNTDYDREYVASQALPSSVDRNERHKRRDSSSFCFYSLLFLLTIVKIGKPGTKTNIINVQVLAA